MIGNRKTWAVDMDGTLCVNKFPEIGEPNKELIKFLMDRRKAGDKVILWTCRVDKRLDEAVEWCKVQGLEFDAINGNLPEDIEKYGNDPRKINADYYIDDKAYSIEEAFRLMSQWADRMHVIWDMDNRDGYTRLHEDFGIPYEAMDYDYNATFDHILHIKENAVKGIDKDAVRWEVPLATRIVWE